MTGTIDNVPVIFMLMQSMSELKYSCNKHF